MSKITLKHFDIISDDMIQEMALTLDYNSIMSLCRAYKRLKKLLCDNAHFWKNKYRQDMVGDLKRSRAHKVIILLEILMDTSLTHKLGGGSNEIVIYESNQVEPGYYKVSKYSSGYELERYDDGEHDHDKIFHKKNIKEKDIMIEFLSHLKKDKIFDAYLLYDGHEIVYYNFE